MTNMMFLMVFLTDAASAVSMACEANCAKLGGSTLDFSLKGNRAARYDFCRPGQGAERLEGYMSCCTVCAEQLDQVCDRNKPCDSTRNLICDEDKDSRRKGRCKTLPGRGCLNVNGKHYENGETFSFNCHTNCTCLDASIGCFSLRTEDSCGEIVGEPSTSIIALKCNETSNWSQCDQSCGWGWSFRTVMKNCVPSEEEMLCYIKPCDDQSLPRTHRGLTRWKNKCPVKNFDKARGSIRSPKQPIHFSNCVSNKKVRMNHCPTCTQNCCPAILPKYNGFKVRRFKFECKGTQYSNNKSHKSYNVMLIKKCRCGKQCDTNRFEPMGQDLSYDTQQIEQYNFKPYASPF